MRVGGHDADKAVGIKFECARRAVVIGVYHADTDVVLVHLGEGFHDAGVAINVVGQLAGQILEHIFCWVLVPLHLLAGDKWRMGAITKTNKRVDGGNVAGTGHKQSFNQSVRIN